MPFPKKLPLRDSVDNGWLTHVESLSVSILETRSVSLPCCSHTSHCPPCKDSSNLEWEPKHLNLAMMVVVFLFPSYNIRAFVILVGFGKHGKDILYNFSLNLSTNGLV